MNKLLTLTSRVVAGLCIASSLSFAQSEARINVNDKALEVAVDVYMNYYYVLDNSSKYYFGANYIKGENDLNKDASLTSANFRVIGETGNEKLSVGMGMKVTMVDNDIDDDFIVIPLGVHAKYKVSSKLSVDGSIYYAPSVLSFSDAKRFFSSEVNVNYQVVNNGFAYLGARRIDTKYENKNDIEFDKSLYAGFKFLF